MTADPFTTIKPQIARDRWQRPLVTPPDGGKPIGYTRASTLGGALEDMANLTRWKQRMTAIGLSERQDLAMHHAPRAKAKRRAAIEALTERVDPT